MSQLYDLRFMLSFYCEDDELAELFAALLLQCTMFTWRGACLMIPGITIHEDENTPKIPDTADELLKRWKDLDKKGESDGGDKGHGPEEDL